MMMKVQHAVKVHMAADMTGVFFFIRECFFRGG
jgi:hypothetical protein